MSPDDLMRLARLELWQRAVLGFVSGDMSPEAVALELDALKSVAPAALMPLLIVLRKMFDANTERNARIDALEEKVAILEASQSVLR